MWLWSKQDDSWRVQLQNGYRNKFQRNIIKTATTTTTWIWIFVLYVMACWPNINRKFLANERNPIHSIPAKCRRRNRWREKKHGHSIRENLFDQMSDDSVANKSICNEQHAWNSTQKMELVDLLFGGERRELGEGGGGVAEVLNAKWWNGEISIWAMISTAYKRLPNRRGVLGGCVNNGERRATTMMMRFQNLFLLCATTS